MVNLTAGEVAQPKISMASTKDPQARAKPRAIKVISRKAVFAPEPEIKKIKPRKPRQKMVRPVWECMQRDDAGMDVYRMITFRTAIIAKYGSTYKVLKGRTVRRSLRLM